MSEFNAEIKYSPTHGQRRLLDVACCLGFVIYAASIVVFPVCLLEMIKDLHLNFTDGGTLELIRSFVLLCILFLGGQIAAKIGKPLLLSMGGWITIAGLLLFSFSFDYQMAVISIMLIGIGSGLLEAIINPLVQDLHPNNPGKALNIVNSFFPLGVFGSSLFIGKALSLNVDWRVIMQVIAGCTVVVSVMFYLGRKAVLPQKRTGLSHIYEIIKRWRFWLFGTAMLCAGAAECSFTFWSASFVRLRFDNLPELGAIATAIFAISMFAGRLISGYITKHIRMRNLILISALLGTIICFFIPIVNSLIFFEILLACAGLCTACFWPSILALAAEELPVDSTLLMIFLACFGIPGFGIAGWLIGWAGDRIGLTMSFLIIPIFFIVLAVTLFTEKWMKKRNIE
ncbi:MAG TPA: MFS transporter [Victivallales bacterium]|nr:MFS transporter [Victivallales bacterium]